MRLRVNEIRLHGSATPKARNKKNQKILNLIGVKRNCLAQCKERCDTSTRKEVPVVCRNVAEVDGDMTDRDCDVFSL